MLIKQNLWYFELNWIELNILKMIYDSIVQSKLLYGLLLWGTGLNDTVKWIQKKYIRTITSVPYVSHTEPLFKRLGV